jgi:hypothetical protein
MDDIGNVIQGTYPILVQQLTSMCKLDAGRCAALVVSEGPLCPDVWRLILSKLTLHEHGRVAATCRDFQEELLSRVTEGRAACISAAQETLGKGLFWGFVTVAQRVLCGLPPYPGGATLQGHGNRLMVNAAGTAQYVQKKEADDRFFTDTQVAFVRGSNCARILHAELCPKLPRMTDI